MDRLSKSLYGWGTVFALGHYVFGPMVRGLFLHTSVVLSPFEALVWAVRGKKRKEYKSRLGCLERDEELTACSKQVAKIIERIVYGPPEKAKGELRMWLKLHTTRMILVDIPAMACFVGGFVHLI